MRSVNTLAAVLILLIGSVYPAASFGDDRISLRPHNQIPKSFKTYSLFLICNRRWIEAAKFAELEQLYGQFQAFGRAIGHDNAAIWFFGLGETSAYHPDAAFAAHMTDVERSAGFCRDWKLKPSEGPHIVVTDGYPDEKRLGPTPKGNYAIYSLGNMSPSEIAGLLDKLTDQLILSGKTEPSTDGSLPKARARSEAPSSMWIRILASTQQTLNAFGCAWSLKVAAGPISAKLAPCNST
jgi:hypothetical protein